MKNTLRFAQVALLSAILVISLQAQTLDEEQRAWVEDRLSQMTVQEKVGQLIVGGSETAYMHVESERFQEILQEIRDYHLGGYHAFRGHVLSAAAMIRRMQDAAAIPLFITADLEGGVGLIFEGGTRFPKAMALAAAGDEELVRQVAQATAREGKALGINVNFYPVVDVNNNPENPIINIRSFGEDPLAVGRLASVYIEAMQSEGLMATAKHFPGHGDTAQDSHLELPVIEAPLERLEQVELPPFKAAVEAGVGAVMTAHLAVPALEPDQTRAASLSSRIVEGVLRRDMDFQGLVITDAMNMGGVVDHFGDGDAAVEAVLAGSDLVLLPRSVPAVFKALLSAVREGRISAQRLEASVRRILSAKARLGLPGYKPVDLASIDEVVGSPEHQELSEQVMEQAITVVRDEKGVLPLRPRPRGTLLLVTLTDSGGSYGRGRALRNELREHHRNVLHFDIDADATSNEIRLLRALAARVDAVVVGGFIRIAAFKGDIALAPNQLETLRQLAALERPTAFVFFGSPYLLSAVPELPTYILAYEDFPGAEVAAARIILGRKPARGKLPVSLPDLYPIGHGNH
ncbi:MAG TPA: glycoside hydrolase family 3 N-terminal domain-containing protein [Acidobacteriota bacterium]|nr:glycoside hydrolase family 3 N-terminal domain-containing protein [Acidobacteriota bacterium]